MDEQRDELRRAVIRFVSAYLHDAGSAATEQGLTVAQAQLVVQLDEPLSMRALAARLFCDASNVTGIVTRLEGRGLVVRESDPGDRRVKLVSLTPSGVELRDKIRAGQLGLFAALDTLDRPAARALADALSIMTPALESARPFG
ncbi:MarR family transcriptional regulator [Actinocorallia lasiicapitis]